jgi:carboxyl-terminal processing protease
MLLLLGIFVGRYIVPAQMEDVAPFRLVSVSDEERQFVFPTFWEAWDKLHTNYIEELNDEELFYGAVEGMIRAAGDPYTVFADPTATKQFQETLQGQFSGVGIEIGLRNGLITVIAPLSGSPAEQAGIREGDVIVAVDDEHITQDTTLDQIVQRIRGPRGEEVTLTIMREGDTEPRDITIVRDTITIESVKVEIEDGLAHLRITSFNGDTVEQLSAAVRQIQQSDVQGIILDVRSNPGGYLQAAVDAASVFLEPGTVVVTEQGRQEKEYKTRGRAPLNDIPIVVLINGGSASASEILAGALHDQRNVPVIGTKTFGKGSVQEMINLRDGSSLRVTVAKWFTPSGRSIDDEGITPTIEVEADRDSEEDVQLERAREELKSLL